MWQISDTRFEAKDRVYYTTEEGAEDLYEDFPHYATPGSAGFDLKAAHDVTVAPGELVLVSTGLRLALPPGYELQIRPRSSVAKNRIIIPNAPGTIDSDYRGVIGVMLYMLPGGDGGEAAPRSFVRGDRIAQAVLARVARRLRFVPASDLTTAFRTERGEGGFGSTGR